MAIHIEEGPVPNLLAIVSNDTNANERSGPDPHWALANDLLGASSGRGLVQCARPEAGGEGESLEIECPKP